MRLLIVEDQSKVAAFMKRGLTEEGHAVDVAGCGDDGILFRAHHEVRPS